MSWLSYTAAPEGFAWIGDSDSDCVEHFWVSLFDYWEEISEELAVSVFFIRGSTLTLSLFLICLWGKIWSWLHRLSELIW